MWIDLMISMNKLFLRNQCRIRLKWRHLAVKPELAAAEGIQFKKKEKERGKERERAETSLASLSPSALASLLLLSGAAILVAMLKGADDVTDPPRPVAMTTSGQAAIACHIVLRVCVCVCEATKFGLQ